VVVAASLWGGGGVVGLKLAEHAGIHPLSVAMWRMLVGGLTLVVALAVSGRLRFRLGRAAWTRILLTGALTALFEAGYFTAIAIASVGLATLIGIGSAPVFVALFDWLVRHERADRLTLAALVLALAGLTLLLSGSLDMGGNGAWGAVIALANGAVFGAITVVNRTPVPGLDPVPLTGLGFTAGGLLLVPVALIPGIGAPSDAVGWGWTLLLGIAITALAYVAYLTGLRTVPPFVATIVALLEPLIAALLGALVLGERLGVVGMVGGALLGTAVVLLRPQRDEPESIH